MLSLAPKSVAATLWLSSIACFGANVRADFEGGSIGPVVKLSETHFRIAVKGQSDQNGRNRQASWYFFRVDQAPRGEMIFDMVDLPGEYNFKPNRGAITKDTPPLLSYDRKTWTHVASFDYDSAEPKLRVRVTPAASSFWIAHTPPYTNEDLSLLRSKAARHADFREAIIGKSTGGRDLYLWTITAAAPKRARRRKRFG